MKPPHHDVSASARRLSPWAAGLTLVLALAAAASADEPVSVSVKKIKDLKLQISGQLTTDVITDTTGSFTEIPASGLVQKRVTSTGADNFAGQTRRTMMSVRSSRLGFKLTMPETPSGLSTEAVFELDFLGSAAPNTSPGAGAPPQSEGSFFTNAAPRIRHAYTSLTQGPWNVKIGQTWSLFGWGPYYYAPQIAPAPVTGGLGSRFPQLRLTHTWKMAETWTLESAVGAAKPAAMNSGNPLIQGGLRLASSEYKGGAASLGGSSMQSLSAALSGDLIPIRTDGFGNPTGQAVIFDLFVPIIPSSDGKSRANTLSWLGEGMAGTGVGGLEYLLLTSGVGNTAFGAALDSGMAGVNAGGNAELIRYRIFRSHLQYFFPGGKWAATGGYTQIEGRNLDRFSTTAVKTAAIAPKKQYAFANILYDPLDWLRLGAEWSTIQDSYNDNLNRKAINNRFQLSTFLTF